MAKKQVTEDVEKVETASVSRAVAEKALEDDRKKRVETCKAELEKILEKTRCTIDVAVVLRKGTVEPQINILAID